MTADEQERFEMLKAGQCVPRAFIGKYYGLGWPLRLKDAFEQYRSTRPQPVQCPADSVPRYELEGYMGRARVVSRKWMGAKLGMKLTSLDALMDKLAMFGMQPSRYAVGDEFIVESLSTDLVRHVPGLRFRTYSDHNSYCERLHAELKNVGLVIEPLFCATSDELGEDYPRLYAMYFDCITLMPLSVKHSVWLDFKKPLNLGPDRCSKLVYARDWQQLHPFRAGTKDPDDLGTYLAHVKRGGNV